MKAEGDVTYSHTYDEILQKALSGSLAEVKVKLAMSIYDIFVPQSQTLSRSAVVVPGLSMRSKKSGRPAGRA